jgi:hypothetical protein
MHADFAHHSHVVDAADAAAVHYHHTRTCKKTVTTEELQGTMHMVCTYLSLTPNEISACKCCAGMCNMWPADAHVQL